MTGPDSRTRAVARKTLHYLVAAAVMASVAIVLVEIGARLLSGVLGISPYMQYDARLGWIARRNTIKQHRDRDGQFDVEYRINEHGFRGKAYPIDKPEGIFRVVVLGDSTGFGWGVAEEQTFSAIVDRELDNVEVINLALSGYGPDQSYLRFVRDGVAFDPDLVVLQASHNDFEEIMYPFFNQKPKPHFRVGPNGALQLDNVPVRVIGEKAQAFHDNSLPVPFKEWLGWNTYAYNLFNEAYYGFRRRNLPNSAPPRNIYTPESVDLFNRIARLLMREVDTIGARGVLIFSAADVSNNHYVADDHLALLDLNPAFRDAGGGNDAVFYFQDGYHWNSAGHRIAAHALQKVIQDMKPGP